MATNQKEPETISDQVAKANEQAQKDLEAGKQGKPDPAAKKDVTKSDETAQPSKIGENVIESAPTPGPRLREVKEVVTEHWYVRTKPGYDGVVQVSPRFYEGPAALEVRTEEIADLVKVLGDFK
jgi:hypothetical protein